MSSADAPPTRIDEYGNAFWEVDGELHREGDLPGVNLSDDTGDRTGWATALKPGFEPIVLGVTKNVAPSMQ